MRFSMKDFFSKCAQIRWKPTDLVTFTEGTLNGKLHFLCSVFNSGTFGCENKRLFSRDF